MISFPREADYSFPVAFSLIPAMGILVVFLEILLGVLVIRFVYAMVVLIIKATKEQRELDRDFLQQAK